MSTRAAISRPCAALLQRAGAVVCDDSGATAVEFGLIAPALFGFLVGALGLGFVLWLQNALDYSVTAAARCAADSPSTCGTSAQITQFAAKASGFGFNSSVFTYTAPAPAPASGTCYKVTASYSINLNIPLLDINNPTLTSSACYPN